MSTETTETETTDTETVDTERDAATDAPAPAHNDARRPATEIMAALAANEAKREALTTELDATVKRLANCRRERGAAIAAGGDREALTREIRTLDDDREGLESALEQLEEARALLEAEHAEATRRAAKAGADDAVRAAVAAIEAMEAACVRFVEKVFAPLDAAISERATEAQRAESASYRATEKARGASPSGFFPRPRAEDAWLSRRELQPLLTAIRAYAVERAGEHARAVMKDR